MDLLFSIAVSAHIGFNDNYNYIHPAIKLQEETYSTGVYYNSEYTLSFFIAKELPSINTEIALVTGYKQYPIVPMIRIKYNDLFITPIPLGNDTGLVIGYEHLF